MCAMLLSTQASAAIVMNTFNHPTGPGGAGGGYFWFGPQPAGLIGIEDYVADQAALQTVASAGTPGNYTKMFINELRYVGGAQTANETITFAFYDAGLNLANFFQYSNGASVGNFIWTITLGANFKVPTVGFVAMFTDNNTGAWFFTDPVNMTVGGSPQNIDGLPAVGPQNGPANYAFRMDAINAIPEPSTMALCGLFATGASAYAARRRKKNSQ